MAARIARIVCMGKLGGYAALLGGAIMDLDGRMLWTSAADLTAAIRRAGIESSDLAIDTRSVSGPSAAVPPVAGRPVNGWPSEVRRAA